MADNKLDIIVATIKAGGATRESIIAASGCTPKAFASYLTSLRNGAKYSGSAICPIEGEDKIFRLGTYDEFVALKPVAGESSAAEKPLAEQHATAVKNINKATAAVGRFQARKEAGEKFEKGGIDDLKFQIAKLQLTLAEKIYASLPALPAEGVVEDGAETVASDDGDLI